MPVVFKTAGPLQYNRLRLCPPGARAGIQPYNKNPDRQDRSGFVIQLKYKSWVDAAHGPAGMKTFSAGSPALSMPQTQQVAAMTKQSYRLLL